jgi:glutamyl-tRNA reductase
MDTLSVVPTIVSLREKAEAIIQSELKKSASALTELTPDQMSAVKILTRSVAEKVISDPIVFLKEKADRPVVNTYLDVARKLFRLDNSGKDGDWRK